MTMGLAIGDLVVLLVRHQSHAEVDNGAFEPLDPASTRRMDFSDTVALPGFAGAEGERLPIRDDGEPALTMPGSEALHVGDVSTGYSVVRTDLLIRWIDDWRTWANGHTHTYHPGTLPLAATTSPFQTAPPVPSEASLQTVRIEVDK